MSLTLKVYCKKVSRELVPKMVKRLNDFDMVVSVHPDFKFDAQEDSGFVPFKFHFPKPAFNILRGKELKSGFELYFDEFDLETEKKNLQPKSNLFGKLLGKKQAAIAYAPPEIETRLKDCKMVVSFVWHADDSFALRFAYLASAILTELTNGVCSYEDDIWYENNRIVDNAFKEVTDYEQSLKEGELDFMEFDGWE